MWNTNIITARRLKLYSLQ